MKAMVDTSSRFSGGQESGREFPTTQESDEGNEMSNPLSCNSPPCGDHDCPVQLGALATSMSGLSKATELSSRCRGRPRLQLETFTLGGILCQLSSAKPVADGMYEVSVRATISADDLSRLIPSTVTNGLHRKKRKRRGIVGMRQSRRTRKEGRAE